MSESTTPSIAFDDIDGINAHAGDEYGDWGPEITVTQDMIQAFADLTGDHQWIHVDVERAKAGPFGGPFRHRVHGKVVVSVNPQRRDAEPVAARREGSDAAARNALKRRNGPLVVHNVEYHRRFIGGCKNHGCVEIAFSGRAITNPTRCDL